MTQRPENWPQGRRPLVGRYLPSARLVLIIWQGGHFKNDLPVSYTVRTVRNNGLGLNRSCNGMSYAPSDVRCKARRTELPRYYSAEMAINMLLWQGFGNAQAVAHGAEAHIVSVFTHFVFMNVFFEFRSNESDSETKFILYKKKCWKDDLRFWISSWHS